MNTTLPDSKKDGFTPAIVLGIAGGIIPLFGFLVAVISAIAAGNFYTLLPTFTQLAFAAFTIWLGFAGSRAAKTTIPFYILLALLVAKAVYEMITTIETVQRFTMVQQFGYAAYFTDIEIRAIAISEIIVFAAVAFSALALLFYLLGKSRPCRTSAVLALVSHGLYLLYSAAMSNLIVPSNSTVLLTLGTLFSVALKYIFSNTGLILGILAFFLYVGKYMPCKAHNGAGEAEKQTPETQE